MFSRNTFVMTDLTQLHAQMKACRLCLEAGFYIEPEAVFSAGSSPEVMLIGQAPGVTEVVAQRPFNASSGRRLFQWLEDAGWEEDSFRQRYYMTAVTKCYPGKHPNGKGDRVPSKEEQALCRSFLEAEIRLVQPRLMILVGGLAIKLLYPKSARLTEIIGTAVYFSPETLKDPVNFKIKQGQVLRQFDPTLDKNGRWVVPLPHPSGASLWPNKPENQQRIQHAAKILDNIRQHWGV